MDDKQKPPGISRRMGRMKIPDVTIDDDDITEVFRQLGFVPWHCEHRPERRTFSMTGTSPLFDLCESGQAAPYYEININPAPNPLSKPQIVVSVRQIPPTRMIIGP